MEWHPLPPRPTPFPSSEPILPSENPLRDDRDDEGSVVIDAHGEVHGDGAALAAAQPRRQRRQTRSFTLPEGRVSLAPTMAELQQRASELLAAENRCVGYGGVAGVLFL